MIKLLKYLLSTILLILYIIVGFALSRIIALIEFIKSIPHVWITLATGRQSKKRDFLSKKDMTDVLRQVEEGLVIEKQGEQVKNLSMNTEAIWMYYPYKAGHD